MIVQIHLSRPELYNQVIQVLSNAGLLHKVELNSLRESCRRKLTQPRVPTTLRVHHVIRREDNKLYDLESGRMLPSTSRGDLDSEQLTLEIASPKW